MDLLERAAVTDFDARYITLDTTAYHCTRPEEVLAARADTGAGAGGGDGELDGDTDAETMDRGTIEDMTRRWRGIMHGDTCSTG
jgi:hypothetical protein